MCVVGEGPPYLPMGPMGSISPCRRISGDVIGLRMSGVVTAAATSRMGLKSARLTHGPLP